MLVCVPVDLSLLARYLVKNAVLCAVEAVSMNHNTLPYGAIAPYSTLPCLSHHSVQLYTCIAGNWLGFRAWRQLDSPSKKYDKRKKIRLVSYFRGRIFAKNTTKKYD